jgi:chaperone BCS1
MNTEHLSNTLPSSTLPSAVTSFFNLGWLQFQEKGVIRSWITAFVVGGSLVLLQHGIRQCWQSFKSRSTLSLEINSKDESFQWIIEWLAQHPYSKHATQLALG